MLRKLKSKVILCEEAGEVLESHLLTALLPSVEHAILIGDHQQLSPKVANYELSRSNHQGGSQYSLDLSLFERLVDSGETPTSSPMGCGHPYATLETQRRMHPSIAQLVRDTLYPNLEDAPSVSEYPEVMGMRKRLFWLDHRVPENDSSEADGNSTSHWNSHEIKMTLALVNHLFQQGEYKEQDIAVGADSVPWTASQAAPGTRKIPCFNARGARPRGSRKSWLRGRSKGEVE
jgi:superfamily I DNA and/or RNA helicase